MYCNQAQRLQIYDYVLRSFTEIWEIKFGNIPYAAALVYDLQRYHPEFAIAVVDQILEDIRIGMEVGHFQSRRRCSTLTTFAGKHLQIQPAKNIVRQVSRGTVHVSRRERVGHLRRSLVPHYFRSRCV